jgi:SAM-dependent methyltransferase
MSKHNVLTEEEFSKINLNERLLLKHIEDCCKRLNLGRSDVNILDWGCGRGREVLFLRERGYNAFGVDVDPEPIRNGLNLFLKKGYDDSLLSLINHDVRTEFPDNFFHLIFSNQVFEHVSDIELVAIESWRITTENGMGYHVYPAHRRILEPHLLMPFVHWLPKNQIRKYLIFACVCLGREPKWLDGSIIEKTNVYFNYSISKTYFRRYSNVRKIFEENGFDVQFETINHPKLKNYKLFYILANSNLSRPIVNHLLLTFKSVELLLTKRKAN